jgi:pyroglutamyl-peptidase
VILLAGFEPFDGLPRNPSAEVAKALEGGGVRAAILPVDHARIAPRLRALLRARYDAVLLTGLAAGRDRLSLERVALNFRDTRRPDARGAAPRSPEVVRGGPAAYFATADVDRVARALETAGFPVEISLSAGGYLCNAAFYLALHALRRRATPCGFLHLPPLPGLPCPGAPMPLERQVEAVRLALASLPTAGAPRGARRRARRPR